jgi:hypothetical protein
MDQARDVSRVAVDTPSKISADELHEILIVAHLTGNVARRRFADGLRAMAESRLYVKLGAPTIEAYALEHFKSLRTHVYENLRVSKALQALPLLSAAFERVELSWSLLVAVTRVANAESVASWLAEVRKH